jgi:hypothetical protein
MEEEKNQVLEISEIISKDFDKAGISSIITSNDFDNLGELKKYLADRIAELLDSNYEKLINILYRIDISEEKLNGLFSGRNNEPIPGRLAELIIERQLQKINFRNMYKNNKEQISD